MKRLELDAIKPGMILGEDIISPKGQTLASAGDVITAQQLLHLSYYGMNMVQVDDETNVFENIDFDAPDEFVGETQSWRIVHSEEFAEFRKLYDNCANRLEEVIDNFMQKHMPLDDEVLLSDIHGVFDRHATGLGIMAMLLNVQGIDTSTYAHSVNVAIISRVFAGWLGITDTHELDVITMCGLYHDIGKSLIPNTILTKPDKLDVNEFARMCEHPLLGYEILKDEEIDRRIKLSALQHHERGDGSGYPYGLMREFTSDYSRLVAIADVYDAMTADRCYRAGICPFEVIAQFQREKVGKYDPEYLPIFLNNIAQSYLHEGVLLSDGSRGKITMINPVELSSPLVCLDDGRFIDLAERKDLYIRACV